MSGDSQPRRDRASKSAKVRPIAGPGDSPKVDLPRDHEAERFVLASVLLDSSRFSEIATLTPDDFFLERHRRVLGAVRDLHESGEYIDCITVADRLKQRNEHGQDDLTFLTGLDNGIPLAPHLDSWVRILRRKTSLRRTILEMDKAMEECSLSGADPAEILGRHLAQIEAISTGCAADRGMIQRVEDLESIFADRSPTEYLVEPELPAKTIVCLAGDSESGKTTLACAWARDALLRGHAVLILDRDKNPRERVRDRLERLGIPPDSELLYVWDCEQKSEPRQPDDPIVVDWVKRMVAKERRAPLVIVDSLISFFAAGEDENTTEAFVKLALDSGVKRGTAREFLKKGVSDGMVRVEAKGRSRRHSRYDADAENGDLHP